MYGEQIVKDGYELGFCLCVVYVDGHSVVVDH